MLLETTYKHRADDEVVAKNMIEKYRAEAEDKGYVVKKASYERKIKKSKGEVIAEAFLVTVTLVYADFWEGLI